MYRRRSAILLPNSIRVLTATRRCKGRTSPDINPTLSQMLIYSSDQAHSLSTYHCLGNGVCCILIRLYADQLSHKVSAYIHRMNEYLQNRSQMNGGFLKKKMPKVAENVTIYLSTQNMILPK
jgi:hypothetical protein